MNGRITKTWSTLSAVNCATAAAPSALAAALSPDNVLTVIVVVEYPAPSRIVAADSPADAMGGFVESKIPTLEPVSYTHLTLPTKRIV